VKGFDSVTIEELSLKKQKSIQQQLSFDKFPKFQPLSTDSYNHMHP
jgi:hypothetical protein